MRLRIASAVTENTKYETNLHSYMAQAREHGVGSKYGVCEAQGQAPRGAST
jgi:hypothetical protein